MPRALTLTCTLALLGCAPGVEYEPRDFVCPAGEEPPCETSEPARPGGWVGRGPLGELDSETRRYVLSWVSIPQPEDGRVVGFNLDGVSGDVSEPEGGPCVGPHEDFVSSTDPGHVGVDNVFGAEYVEAVEGLLGADVDLCPNGADGCLDEHLRASVASGENLLLLTISDLDSLRYDPSVTLELAVGTLPGGAELELDAEGRVAPDQRFEVEQLWSTGRGDIFDGRLRAAGLELLLSISINGDVLEIPLRSVELRFDLSEDRLVAGALGGLVSVADLVEAGGGHGFDPRAVFEGFADVGPSETRDACEFISFGAEFEAVPSR